MRNKSYVIGLLVAALLLGWGAVHAAMSDSGLILAAIPAVLALALVVGAVKVARAESFAPKKGQRWDVDNTPEVQRWLDARADRAAEQSSAPRR